MCAPEEHANGYLNAIKHESKYYTYRAYNYVHEKYAEPSAHSDAPDKVEQ